MSPLFLSFLKRRMSPLFLSNVSFVSFFVSFLCLLCLPRMAPLFAPFVCPSRLRVERCPLARPGPSSPHHLPRLDRIEEAPHASPDPPDGRVRLHGAPRRNRVVPAAGPCGSRRR